MKHYYAFDWTKGVGTYDSESNLPIGDLHIFESSRDRDNYVSCNDEATDLEASVAKKVMAHDIFRYSPNQAYFSFLTESYYIQTHATDEIVKDYRMVIKSYGTY